MLAKKRKKNAVQREATLGHTKRNAPRPIPNGNPLPIARLVSSHSAKINYVVDLVVNSDPDDFFLIFCDQSEPRRNIDNALQLLGVKGLFSDQHGKFKALTAKDFEAFQHTTEYKLLSMPTRSNARGLHLTRANKVIFMAPLWDAREEAQGVRLFAACRLDLIRDADGKGLPPGPTAGCDSMDLVHGGDGRRDGVRPSHRSAKAGVTGQCGCHKYVAPFLLIGLILRSASLVKTDLDDAFFVEHLKKAEYVKSGVADIPKDQLFAGAKRWKKTESTWLITQSIERWERYPPSQGRNATAHPGAGPSSVRRVEGDQEKQNGNEQDCEEAQEMQLDETEPVRRVRFATPTPTPPAPTPPPEVPTLNRSTSRDSSLSALDPSPSPPRSPSLSLHTTTPEPEIEVAVLPPTPAPRVQPPAEQSAPSRPTIANAVVPEQTPAENTEEDKPDIAAALTPELQPPTRVAVSQPPPYSSAPCVPKPEEAAPALPVSFRQTRSSTRVPSTLAMEEPDVKPTIISSLQVRRADPDFIIPETPEPSPLPEVQPEASAAQAEDSDLSELSDIESEEAALRQAGPSRPKRKRKRAVQPQPGLDHSQVDVHAEIRELKRIKREQA
jgi:hypothetical protein